MIRNCLILETDRNVAGFSYDIRGRRAQKHHGNGTAATYTYNVASEVTGIAHKKASTVLAATGYTRNQLGDIIERSATAGKGSYQESSQKETPFIRNVARDVIRKTPAAGSADFSVSEKITILSHFASDIKTFCVAVQLRSVSDYFCIMPIWIES